MYEIDNTIPTKNDPILPTPSMSTQLSDYHVSTPTPSAIHDNIYHLPDPA